MGPLLVIVFLLVPVVEIYVIIQVGQVIGALPTVALLIIESLIGAWLLKREGRVAWAHLQQSVASGRLPAQELVDAGLVLVGGTLLLAPGFITDVVGFFFILAPTRPVARRLLIWLMVRRTARAAARRAGWGGQPSPRPSAERRTTGGAAAPTVIPGELVTGPEDAGADHTSPDHTGPDHTGPDVTGPDEKGPGRVAGG